LKTSSSSGPNDLPPRSLLTPTECADFFRVSRQTIYFWIDQGILHGQKFGGVVRVPTAEVLRVISPSTEE
jgi:excisionase family DNA binding protein